MSLKGLEGYKKKKRQNTKDEILYFFFWCEVRGLDLKSIMAANMIDLRSLNISLVLL